MGAVYLRIDTIEQALRELCSFDVQGEGYGLAYRIARDNLRLGASVVADSCNPIELTRREWARVARDAGVGYVNIEIVCSDPAEHRRRAEGRTVEVSGLKQPTWDEIEHREYDAWTVDRIVVDTAGRSETECQRDLLSKLSTPQRAMQHSLGLIAIVVRDYAEALAFYTGVLGFDLIEDTFIPEQNKRWVVVAPKGAHETRILLARAVGDEQSSRIGNQTGGRVFLFLYTDDFWRDYRAYRARGVEFVREPKDERYGTVAVFRDLYGNLWDLLEPRPDP